MTDSKLLLNLVENKLIINSPILVITQMSMSTGKKADSEGKGRWWWLWQKADSKEKDEFMLRCSSLSFF